MKILIISDQHFGARNDSEFFDKYFEKFYTEYFFPLVEKEKPDVVFDLGDTFDRRKYVNFITLKNCKKYYFEKINNLNIPVHVLLGNHTTYYRNTNDVNGCSLLLKEFQNIKVYDSYEEIILDNIKFLMMPWIPTLKETECKKVIVNSKANILCGHFDIYGFKIDTDILATHGFRKNQFKKFDMVLTGHYHLKQSFENIHYVGSPYELTWSDYNIHKGIHILDTKNLELTFYRNPFKLYKKIMYNTEIDVNMDLKQYENCYVQIVKLKNDNNFNLFLDRLNDVNPIHIDIKEYIYETKINPNFEELTFEETTLSLLQKYTKNNSKNADKLIPILNNLYKIALGMEEE